MDFFQSQVSAQSGFDFIPSFFEGLGEKTHIFRIIIYNQYAAMLGVVDNDLKVITMKILCIYVISIRNYESESKS